MHVASSSSMADMRSACELAGLCTAKRHVPCEGTIYCTQYDAALQAAIRNRRTPDEAMGAQGLTEVLQEIEEEYAEEKKASGDLVAMPTEGAPTPGEIPVDAAGGGADADIQQEVHQLTKDLEDDAKEKVFAFRRHAATLVKTHVKLIQEGATDLQISAELAASRAGQVRGDAGKGRYVAVVYDLKVSGEASRAPAYLLPP